jgi:hypothetical protein
MKVLPEHIFEKTSHLAPDEVIRRIQQRTEPSWDKLRYLKSGKPFAGQVLKNSFKLIRVDPIRSKNRPLISGKVSATDLGSRITIMVGYNQQQSLFFLSVFVIFIFFALNSFIPSKLIALGITVLIALFILGLLRLDFDRECHEIEEEFDKSL